MITYTGATVFIILHFLGLLSTTLPDVSFTFACAYRRRTSTLWN